MLPQTLGERIRFELQKKFYQNKVRNLLTMYQEVLYWQFGDCAPIMGKSKWNMHNQVERIIGTIYQHNVSIKRGRDHRIFQMT